MTIEPSNSLQPFQVSMHTQICFQYTFPENHSQKIDVWLSVYECYGVSTAELSYTVYGFDINGDEISVSQVISGNQIKTNINVDCNCNSNAMDAVVFIKPTLDGVIRSTNSLDSTESLDHMTEHVTKTLKALGFLSSDVVSELGSSKDIIKYGAYGYRGEENRDEIDAAYNKIFLGNKD